VISFKEHLTVAVLNVYIRHDCKEQVGIAVRKIKPAIYDIKERVQPMAVPPSRLRTLLRPAKQILLIWHKLP
jgi:hypothetical protein